MGRKINRALYARPEVYISVDTGLLALRISEEKMTHA